MILEAIKKGKTTRADILAYIKTIKHKNVAGVTVSFNEFGDLSGSGLMNSFVVRNGVIRLNGKA